VNYVRSAYLPEWTEYRSKSGLDPLGMQNTSVNLYQALIPGIGNVTLRMRYYGLYAWLSWIYAQRVGDTNPLSWQRFIRRTEALYALIAQHRGGEYGITGINWAQRRLSGVLPRTIDFADDAEPKSPTYYFKLPWGAYGLAYASQLFEVGIFTEAREHEIPVPSELIGEKLAQAFDNELGELAQPFYKAIERGRVSDVDLGRFGRLAPSGVRKTGPERALYEDILFAHAGLDDANALSRKASLRLILKVTSLLKRNPSPNDVRWILYACEDEIGRHFNPGGELKPQQERWQGYHANDLCHVALETLLKFLLDTLAEYPHGVSPAVLIRRCSKEIATLAKPAPKSWNHFVEAVPDTVNPNDAQNGMSEWALAREVLRTGGALEYCSVESALKAVTLLAVLHKRFQAGAATLKRELGKLDATAFHSLLTESRFLDQYGDDPFSLVIARLLEERVLRRHLWVALKKLRHQGDYTFLIETDDGLIRLRKKDGPVLTNPRLGPSIRFLRDIHLIDDQGLTQRGTKVLEMP
jgi:hypothetical protein